MNCGVNAVKSDVVVGVSVIAIICVVSDGGCGVVRGLVSGACEGL